MKICALIIGGWALASCSVHPSYTTATNESVHPININYIDVSDSLLRTVTLFPGQRMSLYPNIKLQNLTLLEIKTGNGGLAWHNFRANGPKLTCAGNCHVIWTKEQQVKLGPAV